MIDWLEWKIPKLHKEHGTTISEYCDSIGCKDCPYYIDKDVDCFSITQMKEVNELEEKLSKLKEES